MAALLGIASLARAQSVDWNALPEMVSKTPATAAALWKTQAVEARKGHLSRSLQPKIDLGIAGVAGAASSDGSYAPQPGSTSAWVETSAELGMNLWKGGQDRHKDDAFEAEAKAAAYDGAMGYAQRLSDARRAWIEAWSESRRLEILSQVVEKSKENRQRAEKKANAGLTSQTDVMEFELRLQELDLEIARSQERKDAALSQLAALLALNSSDMDLGAGLNSWPEAQIAREGAGLEELALSSESQARLSDAGAQGSWPFPSLDAGLRGLIGGPDTSLAGAQGYEGRLGLSLSLWESGQASAERNSFNLQSKALDALARGAKREREVRVGFLLRRMDRWNGISKGLGERLNLAEKFRDKVSQEYARGVKDGRDLEGATQAVLEASSALVEAQSAAWEAWSDLEKFKP